LSSGRNEGKELLSEVTIKSWGKPKASLLVKNKRMFLHHPLVYIRTGNSFNAYIYKRYL